ncbi:sugar phosphate isomerase/epimerase family protein [Pseudonocardia sp.]|uniref:sugar phosphate isomerase/epimerase family protein n=1 Tax=Pseudonocardia sp. TaxID=60912 RepID=UPI003D14B27E
MECPFPGPPPLVMSSYTLGTGVPFAERVAAAGAAGFDGIGLRVEDYADARAAGLDDAAMRALAAERGVAVREVEYVTGWGDPTDPAVADRERAVLHMARAFGVAHVNAGLLEKLPVEAVTAAYAGLCDRAGPEVAVALEFMPYSGVPDLATAWQVVRDAGRPNGALLVDVWHWARAGTTAADLAAVPAERIVAVQLCDVRAEPMAQARAESLGHRLPPGQGFGDAVGMVRALARHGVAPRIVAVEVISDAQVARGVRAAALVSADAARDVLRRAGPV